MGKGGTKSECGRKSDIAHKAEHQAGTAADDPCMVIVKRAEEPGAGSEVGMGNGSRTIRASLGYIPDRAKSDTSRIPSLWVLSLGS